MEWQQQNHLGNWVRLPHNASKKLEAALQKGETQCTVKVRGVLRQMDLVRMTQTSLRGNVQKVRPIRRLLRDDANGAALSSSAHGNFAMYDNHYDDGGHVPDATLIDSGRQAAVPAPAPGPASPVRFRVRGVPHAQTTWKCTACTLENPGTRVDCEACYTQRPPQYPNPQQQQQQPQPSPYPQSPYPQQQSQSHHEAPASSSGDETRHKVMVPDAWTPGTLLMVGAPDGRTMKVGVPAGLRPGDYFVVVFPPPAGSGVSAGAGAKPVAGSAGPSEPDEDTELAEAMRMSLAEEREKAELERQLEEAKEASRRELAVEQERRQLAAEAEARRLSEEARRREAVRQQELERARVMWQQQQREAQQLAAERAAREHAEREAQRAQELAAEAKARAQAEDQARRKERAMLTERRDSLQREIEAANAKKLEAVEEEDYLRAKELKAEAMHLTDELSEVVAAITAAEEAAAEEAVVVDTSYAASAPPQYEASSDDDGSQGELEDNIEALSDTPRTSVNFSADNDCDVPRVSSAEVAAAVMTRTTPGYVSHSPYPVVAVAKAQDKISRPPSFNPEAAEDSNADSQSMDYPSAMADYPDLDEAGHVRVIVSPSRSRATSLRTDPVTPDANSAGPVKGVPPPLPARDSGPILKPHNSFIDAGHATPGSRQSEYPLPDYAGPGTPTNSYPGGNLFEAEEVQEYPNAAENDLAGYPEPQYARPPTPQGSGPLSIAAARPVAVARVKASSPVRVITRPVSQGHHRAGLPVAVARPRVVAQKRPPPGPAPKNAAGHTAVAIGRPPSFNPDCAPSTAASPEKLRASADRNQYRALLLRPTRWVAPPTRSVRAQSSFFRQYFQSADHAPSAPSFGAPRAPKSRQKWRCGACTFDNAGSNDSCEMCGSHRQ